MTGRTWQIELPCGPLLTANDRPHHMKRYRITTQLREDAAKLAKAAKIPPLQRAHVWAFIIPPDKRRRDPPNWYPSIKAAIDGLVDAHVLPDDTPAYLSGPEFHLGEVRTCVQRNVHLTLYIRELT